MGEKAGFAIEVHDDGVKGFGGRLQVGFFRDGIAEMKEGSEVFLFEIFIKFAFGEFCRSTGLCDIGKVGIDWQRVTKALCDEDLSRSIW